MEIRRLVLHLHLRQVVGAQYRILTLVRLLRIHSVFFGAVLT
jgi:hypothetical protein